MQQSSPDRPQQPQQQHPFRIRTVTVFLQLSAHAHEWEPEIAAAGRFLAHAGKHLEALGYEVQTTRIATQPFSNFLAQTPKGDSTQSHSTGQQPEQHHHQQKQDHDLQQQQQEQAPHTSSSSPDNDVIIDNAVRLEAMAARHGIGLVSLGSTSDPQHLSVIPRLIAATSSTSCTFALPAEPDWGLCQQVAEAIMEVAELTGGMGNFRFASASNMIPGIPYFPVACCGPQHHRTFAIGTESDALLHQALATAADAAAAGVTGRHAGSTEADGAFGSSTRGVTGSSRHAQRYNVLQSAQQQLEQVLVQHLAPLESAALQIEAEAAAAAQLNSEEEELLELPLQLNSPEAASTKLQQQHHHQFKYLGLDSSLAPGLDTPPLTESYELLLRFATGRSPDRIPPQADRKADLLPGIPGVTCTIPDAVRLKPSGPRFGGPGTLTISSMITNVLKGLPLRLTGYCGLMLAVCEDQGLAEAAAYGTITISQLLQYSAVCGCGLDTVPVPGPAALQSKRLRQGLVRGSNCPSAALDEEEAEELERDAETTACIAGLVSDVNTLAYRLSKPLACRLLPLPGTSAGDLTDFKHPYMINSAVMDLQK